MSTSSASRPAARAAPAAPGQSEAEPVTVNVYVPTPFRHLVGNRARVRAAGGNLRQVMDDLDAQFPGFTAQVRDASGEIASHIGVYVNQIEVEALNGEATALAAATRWPSSPRSPGARS